MMRSTLEATAASPAGPALSRSAAAFRFAALALCALAFGLRWYALGWQSLWYDEALSVSIAAAPLSALVGRLASQDVHPPLYFVLLHGWMLGAGMGEAAVRALSAWWSTLAVAAMIVVGVRLAGRATGLAAGALACASPLMVYYGQETRMYALLSALALLTAYAFLRAAAGQRRWWLLAALAAAGSLWTHLAAALLFLAFNGWYLGRVLAHVGRSPAIWSARDGAAAAVRMRLALVRLAAGLQRERAWLLSQGGALLLFAPWLPVAVTRLRTYASPVHGGALGWMLEQTAIVYSFGESVVGLAVVPGTADFAWQDALARRLLVPFLAAFALGMVVLRRRLPFLLCWLLIPAGGIMALALREHGFDARYLIGSAPAFLLLVAAGLAYLWRTARRRLLAAPLSVAVAGSFAYALANLYANPVYARDDNRAVVQTLAQQAVPGAAVILDGNFLPPFSYYAHGRWPVLDVTAPLTSAPAAAHLLAGFTTGRPEVWLALWHDYYTDPHRLAWNWLLQHYYASDWIDVNDDFKLLRFDALPAAGLQPADATFANAVQLVGYTARVLPGGPAGAVQVDLYWRTVDELADDDAIALHVLDGAGNVYASAIGPPAAGRLPMTSWAVGDQYHTSAQLPLAAWTAPGGYRLQVQLVEPETLTYLGAAGQGAEGTSVMLPLTLNGPLPATTALPSGATATGARFAGVGTLAGWALAGSGSDRTVTLYWRADAKPAQDYTVFIHALDASGKLLATGDSEPAAAAAPTSSWQPGELVRDVHHIAAPAGPAVAAYAIGLYDARTGARVAVIAPDGSQPVDKSVSLAAR